MTGRTLFQLERCPSNAEAGGQRTRITEGLPPERCSATELKGRERGAVDPMREKHGHRAPAFIAFRSWHQSHRRQQADVGRRPERRAERDPARQWRDPPQGWAVAEHSIGGAPSAADGKMENKAGHSQRFAARVLVQVVEGAPRYARGRQLGHPACPLRREHADAHEHGRRAAVKRAIRTLDPPLGVHEAMMLVPCPRHVIERAGLVPFTLRVRPDSGRV
jgi:hypothetical protein